MTTRTPLCVTSSHSRIPSNAIVCRVSCNALLVLTFALLVPSRLLSWISESNGRLEALTSKAADSKYHLVQVLFVSRTNSSYRREREQQSCYSRCSFHPGTLNHPRCSPQPPAEQAVVRSTLPTSNSSRSLHDFTTCFFYDFSLSM